MIHRTFCPRNNVFSESMVNPVAESMPPDVRLDFWSERKTFKHNMPASFIQHLVSDLAWSRKKYALRYNQLICTTFFKRTLGVAAVATASALLTLFFAVLTLAFLASFFRGVDTLVGVFTFCGFGEACTSLDDTSLGNRCPCFLPISSGRIFGKTPPDGIVTCSSNCKMQTRHILVA